MNSTQEEIVDTGSIIRNIEIEEDITYRKDYISIDKDIFIDSIDFLSLFRLKLGSDSFHILITTCVINYRNSKFISF